MPIRSCTRLAAICCLATLATSVFADQERDDAQAAADRWDRAYNSGDAVTLGKLYTEDAVVVTKGKPQSGEDIGKFFAGLRSKGWEDHKTSVTSAQPKGDLLVVTGRWAMSGPGADGARKTFEGNWVNVMERKGGELKTLLHTWN